MKALRFSSVSVVAVFLLLAPVFSYSALIGASSGTNSFYSIDPSTGAASFIVSSDRNISLPGVSYLGQTLYASGLAETLFETVSVDLTDGSSTFVSDQQLSQNWFGLAGDQSANLLYTIDFEDGNRLKSLAPDGTVTAIGTGTGIQGRGMAFDDSNDILYALGPGFDAQSLYTIDVSTGSSTLIGSTGISSPQVGLAYDEDFDILYMLAAPDFLFTNLYSIDVSNGSSMLIGSTGVIRMDGFGWQPSDLPVELVEPSSFLLLIMCLAGFIWIRISNR